MKILLQSILFYPAIGGIENYLYYVSKELLKMGHEPTILCSQNPSNLPMKEVYEGIKIIRHPYYRLPTVPFALINPIYYIKKLLNFLEKDYKDYDTIWARYFYEAFASGKAFKGKMPIIFIQAAIASTLNSIDSKNFSLIKKIYSKSIIPQFNFIEKKAIEMSDKVVVLSCARKREIRDFYNLRNKKIKVIPPGVDLKVFKPSIREKYILRDLELPEDSKIILTVCRLAYGKNLEMLFRAFCRIKNKNTYLVIVGDGLERTYLEQLARKLKIIDKIRFLGTRKDVAKIYSIADVFVLPSKYEGFGHVFLEAMASGVPCIGLKSDYPNVIVATEEIIEDSKTGYCVDPYSIEDLAEKIEKIILNDELRHQMGCASRNICEKKYSWENHVINLIKLTENIKNNIQ